MRGIQWNIEPLSSAHNKNLFSCGKPSLDTYLKQYASQNQKKGTGRTFVAVKPGDVEIKGFYTLSSGNVSFANLPDDEKKGLPKYPIPVVHMGRLAVHQDTRGCGLGSILLVDALKRSVRVSAELGICGIEVYALDDEAKSFYLKYGFIELADDSLHLYLSMKIVLKLIS